MSISLRVSCTACDESLTACEYPCRISVAPQVSPATLRVSPSASRVIIASPPTQAAHPAHCQRRPRSTRVAQGSPGIRGARTAIGIQNVALARPENRLQIRLARSQIRWSDSPDFRAARAHFWSVLPLSIFAPAGAGRAYIKRALRRASFLFPPALRSIKSKLPLVQCYCFPDLAVFHTPDRCVWPSPVSLRPFLTLVLRTAILARCIQLPPVQTSPRPVQARTRPAL